MTQRQAPPETFEEKLAQLHELREAAIHSSPEAEAKQHARGQYTAASGSRSSWIPAPSRSSTRSSATARPTST
jgi:hypothetical protein